MRAERIDRYERMQRYDWRGGRGPPNFPGAWRRRRARADGSLVLHRRPFRHADHELAARMAFAALHPRTLGLGHRECLFDEHLELARIRELDHALEQLRV